MFNFLKKKKIPEIHFYGKDDYIKNVCDGIEPNWSENDKIILKIIEMTKTSTLQWYWKHDGKNVSDGRIYEATYKHTKLTLDVKYGCSSMDINQLTHFSEYTTVLMENTDTHYINKLRPQTPFNDTCLFVDLKDLVYEQDYNRAIMKDATEKQSVVDTFYEDINNKD